ncbi:MAG: diacylglycerol kinase [Burkholderiales bacterium]|nr:diacylglycerol kinase [Burkholderiales bacterium]
MEGNSVNAAPLKPPHKGKRGLVRVWRACGYALSGLAAAFRHEDAFRQEAVLAAILIPVAFLTPSAPLAKALLVASVLLVLIVELLNSALEAAVDRISLESHVLAKRAKDIGSAAVFLSLVNLLVVWGVVLLS